MSALALLAAGPCVAQESFDAKVFCQKAGRNQAIYERALDSKTVRAGASAGAVTCGWTFSHLDAPDLLVTLDSKLLHSPLAARQTILMARLPENRHGKIIEPLPRLGDDGLSRATKENGILTLFEIEAVQGVRHYLLSVRMRDGSDVNYRLVNASINFVGVGISTVERH